DPDLVCISERTDLGFQGSGRCRICNEHISLVVSGISDRACRSIDRDQLYRGTVDAIEHQRCFPAPEEHPVLSGGTHIIAILFMERAVLVQGRPIGTDGKVALKQWRDGYDKNNPDDPDNQRGNDENGQLFCFAHVFSLLITQSSAESLWPLRTAGTQVS